MSLAVAALVAGCDVLIMGGHIGAGFLAAVGGLFAELAILVAASVFFSTVASPVVAAASTLGVWVIGHIVTILPWFTEAWKPGLARSMTEALYLMLPNLEELNYRPHAAYDLPIDAAQVCLAMLATVAWSAVFLGGAWAVFRRKDL